MIGTKQFDGWHHRMRQNEPTCYIDYTDGEHDFIVHVHRPIGHLKDWYKLVWLYPCVFNNKGVKLIQADWGRMGRGDYGTWGVHYV